MDFIGSLSLATILWLILGIALVAWIGVTAVLWYHWHEYARGDRRMRRMSIIYIVGSLLMLGSALTFIFSL